MEKIKIGMIGGGGEKNFFGAVHRRAISLDTTRNLVAGALRRQPEDALASARELGIQGYRHYEDMVRAIEKEELKLDYVVIVTPNNAHFAPAKAFIECGIPVLCEKPMTFNIEEARELSRMVKEKNVSFVLAHTYTGHPMVMLAREMVKSGEIGDVRKVESWYNQGWLAKRSEDEGLQQAQWRVDPEQAGISCCGGDIGTHAHMAVRWVTGLEVVKVSSRLNTFVRNRKLDDDFNVIAELQNGGTAIITATQIAIGHKNDHGFRIMGTKATLEWHQERAEKLVLRDGKADKIYWLGANLDYFPQIIKSYLRLPAGHHEDFFEALANLHLTMERKIRQSRGEKDVPPAYPHPDVEDGLWGMAFVTAAVKSSCQQGKWTNVEI